MLKRLAQIPQSSGADKADIFSARVSPKPTNSFISSFGFTGGSVVGG